MMTNDGISVADALALRNTGYENDGFGGGNGAWWIIILILFFAVGGFGRGFGNNEERNGGYNACCTPATQQGVTDAFNFNQLDNGIRGLSNGICDGFYAQNNSIKDLGAALQQCCCDAQLGMERGFNGMNQTIANLGYQMNSGFCDVDKSIMQSNFQNQASFNNLNNQLASCCCDILTAGEKNTDRIINYLTQTEMDKLRTELQSAQFQLSQLSQTSNIVNQLMPVAKPAYITCSPFASAFGNPFNGCGCNTGGCCV